MDLNPETLTLNPRQRGSAAPIEDSLDSDRIYLRNNLRLYIRAAWHVVIGWQSFLDFASEAQELTPSCLGAKAERSTPFSLVSAIIRASAETGPEFDVESATSFAGCRRSATCRPSALQHSNPRFDSTLAESVNLKSQPRHLSGYMSFGKTDLT